ncbi:MAG: pyridine nucleotide-disulfide oxidoreductase, partial [Desulfobacterales bacterium]|nr:pyridine nucleotide-disulfide oxidoreductase [Desulfobacterales bacterium]
QCVSYPEIFGGGDCISFKPRPLTKVGVYAVRQNSILFNNLQTALQGGAYQRFVPQKTYLLIFNMGDGTGIFVRNSLVWRGRSAFILKNFIDTTFMKKFQVSGERSEQG